MTLTQRQKNTGVILIMIGSLIIAGVTFLFIFRTPDDTETTPDNGAPVVDDTIDVTGVELLPSEVKKIFDVTASFISGYETYNDESGYYNVVQSLNLMTEPFRKETEEFIAEQTSGEQVVPSEVFFITTEILDVSINATSVTLVNATVTTEQTEIRGNTTNITNPSYIVKLQKIGDEWLVSDFSLI